MARTAWLSRWRGKAAGIVLAPLAWGVFQVAPGGVPEAEGCSGAGPTASWGSLYVLRAGEATSVAEIGSDGFIVFGGHRSAGADGAVESVVVSVTDAAGEAVPGQVSLLHQSPIGLTTSVALGWTANEPLAMGARLKAVIQSPTGVGSTSGEVSIEQDLEVVGEPAQLQAGAMMLGDWIDFGHGVGPLISCLPGASGCGPLPASWGMVPEAEEQRDAVETLWQPPAIRGFVAWEASVVAVGAGSDASAPEPGRPLFYPTEGEVSLGTLVFGSAPEQHCVALKVTDLRTGAEVQTEPVCQKPQAPARVETDTALRNCREPPNEALTERWCKLTGFGADVCQRYRPGAPSTPGSSAGAPNAPAGEGGSGPSAPAGSGSGPSAPASGRMSTESSGCHLGPGRSSPTALVVFALALSLAGRRRSQRRAALSS